MSNRVRELFGLDPEYAKKEVEESLISSLEQKLKENLAKDTIEKMNIPEVLKRFTEMSLEQKQ